MFTERCYHEGVAPVAADEWDVARQKQLPLSGVCSIGLGMASRTKYTWASEHGLMGPIKLITLYVYVPSARGAIPRIPSRQCLLPAASSIDGSSYPPEVATDMRRVLATTGAVTKSTARAGPAASAPKVRVRACTPPPLNPATVLHAPVEG